MLTHAEATETAVNKSKPLITLVDRIAGRGRCRWRLVWSKQFASSGVITKPLFYLACAYYDQTFCKIVGDSNVDCAERATIETYAVLKSGALWTEQTRGAIARPVDEQEPF